MSKSVPVARGLKTNGINDMAEYISKQTGMKVDTVKSMLSLEREFIMDRLLHGENVNLPRLGTFKLRRREYSKERQQQQKNGFPGHFPPYCWYPYFEVGHLFRKEMADRKGEIEKIVMGEA